MYHERGRTKVYDHVLEAILQQFDENKCPGSPLCFQFPTNAGLKGIKNELFDDVELRLNHLETLGALLLKFEERDPDLVKVLWSMHDTDWSGRMSVALVEAGLCDPVLLKKKGEGREIGKDPRLVCMVSARDTFCARVVIGNALKEEQNQSTPTCVGLDLTTPERTLGLHSEFLKSAPLKSTDVSGFEYACTTFYQYCDLKRWRYVLDLKEWNSDDLRTNRILTALVFCECYRVLQTEDGELLVGKPGEQSSGKLKTFSSNSFIRGFVGYEAYAINHYVEALHGPLRGETPFPPDLTFDQWQEIQYATTFRGLYGSDERGRPRSFNAGDDNLDSYIFTRREVYLALGFNVTDVLVQEDVFNFCSTIFTDKGSYQENIRKFVFHMLVAEKDHWDDRMRSFHSCFLNHPEYSYAYEILMLNAPVEAPSLVEGGD